MEQLILHLLGDYLLQSHWMALEKTKNSLVCLIHSLIYSLPFLFLTNLYGILFISLTHFFIDRFRLAKHIIILKNYLAPLNFWILKTDLNDTGYPKTVPIWLSFWLLIITDNTLHIICNYFSILIF